MAVAVTAAVVTTILLLLLLLRLPRALLLHRVGNKSIGPGRKVSESHSSTTCSKTRFCSRLFVNEDDISLIYLSVCVYFACPKNNGGLILVRLHSLSSFVFPPRKRHLYLSMILSLLKHLSSGVGEGSVAVRSWFPYFSLHSSTQTLQLCTNEK